jgi:1,4-alpha-glucan branching enzyme
MLLDSYTAPAYQPGGADRYSAKRTTREVNFFYIAAEAKSVSVIGDFNNWQPGVHAMKRQPDGGWLLRIPLHHGHHRYAFCVDGKAVLDPRAQGISRNDHNERVSLIAVS